jgi:hypothetical protein
VTPGVDQEKEEWTYTHFGLDLIEESPVDPNQIPELFSIIGKGSTSFWQLPKTHEVNY